MNYFYVLVLREYADIVEPTIGWWEPNWDHLTYNNHMSTVEISSSWTFREAAGPQIHRQLIRLTWGACTMSVYRDCAWCEQCSSLSSNNWRTPPMTISYCSLLSSAVVVAQYAFIEGSPPTQPLSHFVFIAISNRICPRYLYKYHCHSHILLSGTGAHTDVVDLLATITMYVESLAIVRGILYVRMLKHVVRSDRG